MMIIIYMKYHINIVCILRLLICSLP